MQERIYLEGTSAECTQSGLCTVLISDFRGLSVGMAPAYTPLAPRGAGEGDHSSHIILVFFSTSLKEAHSDQNSECAGQMRLRINPQVPLLPGQLTPQAVLLRASRAAIGVYPYKHLILSSLSSVKECFRKFPVPRAHYPWPCLIRTATQRLIRTGILSF